MLREIQERLHILHSKKYNLLASDFVPVILEHGYSLLSPYLFTVIKHIMIKFNKFVFKFKFYEYNILT